MNKYTLLLIPFLFIFALSAAPGIPDSFLFGAQDNRHISVNNRVLAHVNGKPITAVDVMKKMDIQFYKQFPEYASSIDARFQYYQVNWRGVLQELMDKELILADAQENKVPLTSGDVRQEMESLFGPNIIGNLDKIGLSFDEAFKIVHGDLMIRKMMMIRVNSKAMRSVTPQVIREAYEEFAAKNMKQKTWHYQVLSIRNSDSTAGALTAQNGYKLLNEDKIPFSELPKKLKDLGLVGKSTVTLSDPIFHTEKDMADLIKNPLLGLEPGQFSQAIAQKSRQDKSTVFRIIFLIDIVPGGAIPYSEIENQIKDELYDKAIAKESDAYLKKLRTHHAIHDSYISDMVPSDFEPFTLR